MATWLVEISTEVAPIRGANCRWASGHSSTVVTEKVYRKELRPVLTRGARAMNALFDDRRAR